MADAADTSLAHQVMRNLMCQLLELDKTFPFAVKSVIMNKGISIDDFGGHLCKLIQANDTPGMFDCVHFVRHVADMAVSLIVCM